MPVSTLNDLSFAYNTGALDVQYVSEYTLLTNGLGVYTALHEIAQLNIAKRIQELGFESVLEHGFTKGGKGMR